MTEIRSCKDLHITWCVIEKDCYHLLLAAHLPRKYAYRLREVLPDGTSVLKHDNDDDGEHGAGSKLAHLLQVRGDMNVLVMVARWYGGIHLGMWNIMYKCLRPGRHSMAS